MPIEIGPTRALGALRDVRTAARAPIPAGSNPAPAAAIGSVIGITDAAPSAVRDAGAPPVDAERVQVIRRAIEQGRYPVVPARVADAMIAAGMLLRSGE